MFIRLASDKEQWNSFMKKRPHASFLHSWEWGEFQGRVGHAPIRLAVCEGEEIIDAVQGFSHSLGLGFQYCYLPRYTIYHTQAQPLIFDFLRKQSYVFLRIEPETALPLISSAFSPTHSRQPKDTLCIDLSKTEEEILQAMHSKTRYNIGLAARKGVTIRTDKQIDVFWQLNEETIQRDKFKSHDKAYYEAMLELPFAYQYTAWIGDTPVVSNICLGFGDTFVYLHGASSSRHRASMAPYMLQWQAMQDAKRLGFHYYDFWGIAPRVNESAPTPHSSFHGYTWHATHPFTGITRFKVGFGGTPIHYVDAGEVGCRPLLFVLYKGIRAMRSR